MLEAAMETIETGKTTRYKIRYRGMSPTRATVPKLWQTDDFFRDSFVKLLADSPFAAYQWETPPLSHGLAELPFEFVLVNAPGFTDRRTDPETFRRYFNLAGPNQEVVTFENQGGDAMLIAPSPRTGIEAYGHLAAFVRSAPRSQVESLWKTVGKEVAGRISDSPLWLSTAGGGVAWLHVRLDSRPKYYRYRPYTKSE